MTRTPLSDEQLGAAAGRALRGGEWSRPAARAAILAAVANERQSRGGLGGVWRWLVTPRAIRLSPVMGALLLALVGGAAALWRSGAGTAPTVAAGPEASALPRAAHVTTTAPAARLTHFALLAPDARSVTLVGDFNNWDPSATPLRQVDGTWHVDIPLAAGRHSYAFVVDGGEWVPDPAAPREQDTDFGRSNSLLLVQRS